VPLGQTLSDFQTQHCLHADSYNILESNLDVGVNIHIFKPHTPDLEVGIHYKNV